MSIWSFVATQVHKRAQPFDTYNRVSLSRSALLSNVTFFRSLMPDGDIIPVLKANAYGHGVAEIATILKAASFPYIAVDSYHERTQIAAVSRQPVLVMGAIKPVNYCHLDLRRTAYVAHDEATIHALGSLRKPVQIHIEIDTGMHRHGVPLQQLPVILDLIKSYPRLNLEGVMSHLADADNPSDSSFTQQQTDQFDSAIDTVRQAGFNPTYTHLAQSAGSTKVSSRHANAMRIGIALYGINPLAETDDNYAHLHQALRPVLQLTTMITKIYDLQPDDTVSYGRTFTATKPMRIGVLPLGYYEAIPRTLSNIGVIQQGNDYMPIVGRVCMNHAMIDLSVSAEAPINSEITVISRDPDSRISVDNTCRRHDLFNYSFLTGINHMIRREIVE